MPDGSNFVPATPGEERYLIGIAGPTGSGKTYSALRLARGLAGPNGEVFAIDTENKRMLRYAKAFNFRRAGLEPPFHSEKYMQLAIEAQKAGAAVLIIDSGSHEHVGPGGTLERFEDELKRLAGDDWAKRERVKGTAWIVPKRAHKALLQRLIQLNMHVIICLRAEPKIGIRPDPDNPKKTVWIDLGFQPIASNDLPFDLTMLLMLSAENLEKRGVAIPLKLDEQDRHLIPLNRPLDEAVGAAIAAKARGEMPTSGESKGAPNPESKDRQAGVYDTNEPRGEAKNLAVRDALVASFEATKVLADHEALIGDEQVQAQLRWLRERRLDLLKPVTVALEASWKRVQAAARAEKDRPRGNDLLDPIETKSHAPAS
jgi:hypothetical protein